MSIEIDELLPEVLLYAPNCADIVAYRFIREAATELCRRTRAWRENETMLVTTPESQGIITIEDAKIFEIEAAALDENPLVPKTPAWLDDNYPGWLDSYSDTGPARFVTQIAPDTVTIVPKVTGTLKMRLVLEPTRTAMTLPNFVLDQYATDVGKGAAGRIMLLPNATVGNPEYGAQLVAEFKSLLDTLSVKATKGQQRAPLRSSSSFF